MNPQGSHALPLPGAGRRGADLDEMGSRGQTFLADKVIEKIAGQIASDESSAGGSSGGFLGIGGHADLSARPKASVELAGNIATIRVEVGMLYPVPLRQATEALRQRIRTRITELTGVEVRQVDIRISWLTTGTNGRRKLL
ncbi:Asp23/Gls24 family envelope stress response protein [Paeniglutamicibacter kerguelensis]|uniref:Alkaline shock family protein YloU n=1 Tax=Paeniglutamicibacter kerguelensis TaxID=254788 RepID=A0ABS4XBZ0_9MICC|nr:Asp23/Gls24 family envelope stress response protein [Paeniglutamicibacter kerguelensis]MBP2385985.1 putative alkaline shock family protein YloU [Paeniglutamicibacter kerguelensis]